MDGCGTCENIYNEIRKLSNSFILESEPMYLKAIVPGLNRVEEPIQSVYPSSILDVEFLDIGTKAFQALHDWTDRGWLYLYKESVCLGFLDRNREVLILV
jgi:hypothetical protein